MQEIFEDYISTKERLTIPPHVHGLPELGEITHINTRTTMEPSSLHYHSKYMEIHCMIRGVRNSTVMEDGKPQSYSVSGNEVFIVMPFELHSNGVQPQKPCELYVCQVSIPDPRRILSLNPEYSLMLYERLARSKNRHWHLSKTEIGMVRTAFNLIANGDEEDRKNGVQVLAGFLFNLHYMTPIEDEVLQPVDENIKRAVDYVNQHLSEPLNSAPSTRLPEELYGYLTYILPNETEIEDMTGVHITHVGKNVDREEARRAASILQKKGVKNVLITLGSAGALLLNGEGEFYSPCATDVKVADPTAAGDSFVGAFCTGACCGWDWETMLVFANHTAAVTVSKMGAMPSLPTIDQVTECMEARNVPIPDICRLQGVLNR